MKINRRKYKKQRPFSCLSYEVLRNTLASGILAWATLLLISLRAHDYHGSIIPPDATVHHNKITDVESSVRSKVANTQKTTTEREDIISIGTYPNPGTRMEKTDSKKAALEHQPYPEQEPLSREVLDALCETQDPPDPAQHWQEMTEAKALQIDLENRRVDNGVLFTCGLDPSFHVPFPPGQTLIQINQAAAIWCALAMESKRLGRPANLLVWGLGYDSSFWATSTQGRVAFLENNRQWFSQVTMRDSGLEAHLVNYTTNLKRDMNRLSDQYFVDTVNDLLPLGTKNEVWDVILADAPNGCGRNDVGRFGAIFTSKSIIDAQGHGHMFVDDFNRNPEQIIADHVLVGGCEQNCGEKVAVWNRVHPASGLFIEKTALFSFGESKNAAAAIRKIDGAGDV